MNPLAEAEEHSGIVGCWEDGLATHADGRKMRRRKAGRRTKTGSRATTTMSSEKKHLNASKVARNKENPDAAESSRLLDWCATHTEDPNGTSFLLIVLRLMIRINKIVKL